MGGYHPEMAPTLREAAAGDGGVSTYTATLHAWTAGAPADPANDARIGEPLSVDDAGGEVQFPPLAEAGLVYVALWLGDTLLWHSEVVAADVAQRLGVNLGTPTFRS